MLMPLPWKVLQNMQGQKKYPSRGTWAHGKGNSLQNNLKKIQVSFSAGLRTFLDLSLGNVSRATEDGGAPPGRPAARPARGRGRALSRKARGQGGSDAPDRGVRGEAWESAFRQPHSAATAILSNALQTHL